MLFGGSTGLDYTNAVHLFDTETCQWQQLAVSGDAPSPRYKHSAVVHDDQLYIIGGGAFKPQMQLIEVYKLDLTTLVWTCVATRGQIPRARVAHSCAYDEAGADVYMFGGFTTELHCLRDFYSFSLQTHTWTRIAAPQLSAVPSARSFHSSVFYEGAVYIFSGSNGKDKFSDVWSYRVRARIPPLLTLGARALCQQYESVERLTTDLQHILPNELLTALQNLNVAHQVA